MVHAVAEPDVPPNAQIGVPLGASTVKMRWDEGQLWVDVPAELAAKVVQARADGQPFSARLSEAMGVELRMRLTLDEQRIFAVGENGMRLCEFAIQAGADSSPAFAPLCSDCRHLPPPTFAISRACYITLCRSAL